MYSMYCTVLYRTYIPVLRRDMCACVLWPTGIRYVSRRFVIRDTQVFCSTVSLVQTQSFEPLTILSIESACSLSEGGELFDLARSLFEVQDSRVAMHVGSSSLSFQVEADFS